MHTSIRHIFLSAHFLSLGSDIFLTSLLFFTTNQNKERENRNHQQTPHKMGSKLKVIAIIVLDICLQFTNGFSLISKWTIQSSLSSTRGHPSLHVSSERFPSTTLNSASSLAPLHNKSSVSPAAQWHYNRRRDMLQKYTDQITHLEQQTHGLFVGLPLLLLSNLSLTLMAIKCQSLSIPQIFLLSIPGSVFSLWTLQILHDALHSSLLPKPSYRNPSKMMKLIIRHRRKIQNSILFFGSMPSAFGYYLYLKFGHLTHHKNLGDPNKVSLLKVFNSTNRDFEDGDVLFTAHRMKLLGETGPKFHMQWPKERELTMSISRAGFSLWKEGHVIRNSIVFCISFLFERAMLIINDFFVALTGKNAYFPHKPESFHRECRLYCFAAVATRLALCATAKSFKPLLFLYLSETLWSLPPHPCCAMFITNHGSKKETDLDDSSCIPSSSTYAGKWYNILTLNTNLHVEHHDFPTIPFHKLGALRKIAPEFYRDGEKDSLFKVMKNTFAHPEFYACMNASNF